MQAVNDDFWTGFAPARCLRQDLSADLAPVNLPAYGRGYRLGYRFG
jgi:hypothetical protein